GAFTSSRSGLTAEHRFPVQRHSKDRSCRTFRQAIWLDEAHVRCRPCARCMEQRLPHRRPQPMAETAIDTTAARSDNEPKEPIADFVGKMSDRAIQRVTGGNAFLRGRLYARRKAVESLNTDGLEATGEIVVRSASEPYKTGIALGDDEQFTSH